MLMNLYRAIDRERIQFDFAVTADKECAYDEEILSLGGRIIRYPRYRVYNHISYSIWWNRFFANNTEYKVVHGHIGSTASIYLSIAKRHNCYTIAHSHSVGELKSLHDYIYKVYSYSTRFIADYFIGCSKKALISRYGQKVYNNTDISMILKNSIDTKKYRYSPELCAQVKQELGIEDYEFIIGTVGRFTEAKNTFFIVDIIHDLKKTGVKFKFVWAGDGELKNKVEQYIKEKELQNDIILLGIRNDINRVIQVFNAFILPSKFEGLPMVGVEAQAAGIPLLCSDQVTKEIQLSDCVKFLPITDTECWVKALLEEQSFRRVNDAIDCVVGKGYDVSEESLKLTRFYEQRYLAAVGDDK